MSMIERVLYWLAIVILIIGLIGLKTQISELEKKTKQVQTELQEGG